MSDIKDWSSTAANNNSTPPDGFPEGMNPSDVNNAAREIMAAVRRQHEDSSWVDLGDTPSYVSATSFTISGDVTTAYAAGRRIRATDSSTLYGVVSSSSYGAPNTTVNVTLDSGSLSGSLSAVALSVVDPNANGGDITANDITANDVTVSGGEIVLDGEITTVTSVNGDAIIGVADTSGVVIRGKGSTNDINIQNSANDSAMRVPTGTRDVVFGGAVTCGAFTSIGIDDNTSKEVFQISDTQINLGDSSSGEVFSITMRTNGLDDGQLIIAGGDAFNDGGTIRLFGSAHSSNPADIQFRSNDSTFGSWDESDGSFDLFGGSGAKTRRFRVRDTNTQVEVQGEFGVSDTIGNRRLRLNASGANATINYANNGSLILQTNSINALTLDTNQNAAAAGKITAGGDTAAGDNATIGYTATEGLILTGQGSTNDVTIKNDADAAVMSVPTGTQNAEFANDVTVTGDISAANFRALTLGTEQATTSGTEIDFTSIPSGVKRISVMIAGVSTNGINPLIIQLGDSGGIETTGYVGAAGNMSSAAQTVTNLTSGLGLTASASASDVYEGIATFLLEDSANNTWVGSWSGALSSAGVVLQGSTRKSLTGTLDRIRLTTTAGVNTFDAGAVNIQYD